MPSKTFVTLLTVISIGMIGFIVFNSNTKPKETTIGVGHKSQGQQHITAGQKHEVYNSDPASSGPHREDASSPALWGVYTQEIPPEIFLHNEEHGGVIVSYNPKLLPADQLKKLQALFAPPYSNQKFTPPKVIVMPRSEDTHPIELASWTWTLNMDTYDEATLITFYKQHEGRSPEPTAGPNNIPINQAR